MIHVTDWLPTLYRAAGGEPTELGDIDGIDQWASLVNQAESKRTEMVYNINAPDNDGPAGAAIRQEIIFQMSLTAIEYWACLLESTR